LSKNLRNCIEDIVPDCTVAAGGKQHDQKQKQQQKQNQKQKEQQNAADNLHAEQLFMKLLLASGYLCRNGNSLSIPNQELHEKLKANILCHHFDKKYTIDIRYYNNVASILSTILDDPENSNNFTRLQQEFENLLNEAASKGASFFN
jgi:DNA primase